MEEPANKKEPSDFRRFAMPRIVLAVVLIVVVVLTLAFGLDYLDTLRPPSAEETADTRAPDTQAADETPPKAPKQAAAPGDHGDEASPESAHSVAPTPSTSASASAESTPPAHEIQVAPEIRDLILGDSFKKKPAAPGTTAQPSSSPSQAASEPQASEHAPTAAQPQKPATAEEHPPAETHPPAEAATATPEATQPHKPLPPGVLFVEATMAPLDHELNHRWWGWRPNDIINVTDNVNNYQLGILEVTRRTLVQLAERISRTGSTDAFNPHLENAMNWGMVKAESYWFPSPESKYKECLQELEAYRQQLMEGKASFYTRSDSIIPLLAAFEDLLGSCDENLVKATEKDGSKVGFFKADNYFYYAKGIASAMTGILEAVHHDFIDVLDKRNGAELLHHAIESCKRAAKLSPWIITNGDLDGVLANHRANMAAPISHAKFYLGQLIKTLST